MLKRFAPKSLYGRTILIVVLPIFIMQSVVTWVFFNRHWEEVTATLAKSTAGDFGYLTQAWLVAPDAASRADIIAMAADELEVSLAFVPEGRIPADNRQSIFDALNRTLDRELDWSLDHPYWYNTQGFDRAVETRVQLPDGYLSFRVDRDRVVARNGHFFIIWLILATLLLGYITLIFLRNQVRSITRLAAAAEAFGRGEDALDFKPSGAREVRQAGHAFLAMRARIRRFLDQRTEMLAGVSHDLKTPLTRMRLNLALQPDTDDIVDLKADVAEMERLLDDYLIFARGDAEAVREEVDISDLTRELCYAAARGERRLELAVPPGLTCIAAQGLLRRALGNLVDNALKHASHARLSATAANGEIVFAVDDNGPGIDPADYPHALKAFGRLDQARSAALPGSGLGLAIVRDVARAHGGSLELSRSDLGGLRATLTLPQPREATDNDA